MQIPLLVELKHPALKRHRHIARDVSEGGVFVHMEPPESIRAGAKMRLTLLDPIGIEHRPSPTVEVEVVRVQADGLGMRFVNKTSRHLWQSVERLREELAIGRDYFQVRQDALLISPAQDLLIVQQSGRWGFPGHYLVVGDDWRDAMQQYLAAHLGATNTRVQRLFSGDTHAAAEMPEAAVYRVFILVAAQTERIELPGKSPYSNHRWVNRRRDLEEITFATDELRQVAIDALHWANAQASDGNARTHRSTQ